MLCFVDTDAHPVCLRNAPGNELRTIPRSDVEGVIVFRDHGADVIGTYCPVVVIRIVEMYMCERNVDQVLSGELRFAFAYRYVVNRRVDNAAAIVDPILIELQIGAAQHNVLWIEREKEVLAAACYDAGNALVRVIRDRNDEA